MYYACKISHKRRNHAIATSQCQWAEDCVSQYSICTSCFRLQSWISSDYLTQFPIYSGISLFSQYSMECKIFILLYFTKHTSRANTWILQWGMFTFLALDVNRLCHRESLRGYPTAHAKFITERLTSPNFAKQRLLHTPNCNVVSDSQSGNRSATESWGM